MAYDFKKEQKNLYNPSTTPNIVNIGITNYLAVRGKGDPNEINGEYQQSIKILYPVAYTLRMSYKTDYKITGFYEYVVPPLEGFWWQENIKGVDYNNKDKFIWISLIRLPDFITKSDFEWAVKTATDKKKQDFSKVEFLTYDEGLCVQAMHIGSYDDEPLTTNKMAEYIKKEGYVIDLSDIRHHHEIYISDPRKTEVSKRRTVIRHPIKKSSL